MVGVHSQRDLGLAGVSSEVALPDHQADEQAGVELGDLPPADGKERATALGGRRCGWLIHPG